MGQTGICFGLPFKKFFALDISVRRAHIGKYRKEHPEKAAAIRVGHAALIALAALAIALAIYIAVKHGQTGLSPTEILKKAWAWANSSRLNLLVGIGVPIIGATVVGCGAYVPLTIRHIRYGDKQGQNKTEYKIEKVVEGGETLFLENVKIPVFSNELNVNGTPGKKDLSQPNSLIEEVIEGDEPLLLEQVEVEFLPKQLNFNDTGTDKEQVIDKNEYENGKDEREVIPQNHSKDDISSCEETCEEKYLWKYYLHQLLDTEDDNMEEFNKKMQEKYPNLFNPPNNYFEILNSNRKEIIELITSDVPPPLEGDVVTDENCEQGGFDNYDDNINVEKLNNVLKNFNNNDSNGKEENN